MSLSSIPPKYQCDLKFDYNIEEILQIQTVQIVSIGQKWWDACVIYAKNHNVAKDSFVWHAASIILIGLQWSLKYYIGCLTPKFRIFSVPEYCKNILLFGKKVERLPKNGNFEQKYDCWRVLAEPGTFSQARPLPIRPNIAFCFRMFNILVTNMKEIDAVDHWTMWEYFGQKLFSTKVEINLKSQLEKTLALRQKILQQEQKGAGSKKGQQSHFQEKI